MKSMTKAICRDGQVGFETGRTSPPCLGPDLRSFVAFYSDTQPYSAAAPLVCDFVEREGSI